MSGVASAGIEGLRNLGTLYSDLMNRWEYFIDANTGDMIKGQGKDLKCYVPNAT